MLAAERDGEQALIAVSDNGIGIPPDPLDQVFRMFTQIPNATRHMPGGLGIGLSLVNKLSHPRIASLMMAFWFLCTAAANFLAGIMEELIKPLDFNLWAFLGVMALVPGLLLLALTPALVKMSHGRV